MEIVKKGTENIIKSKCKNCGTIISHSKEEVKVDSKHNLHISPGNFEFTSYIVCKNCKLPIYDVNF